MVLSYKAKQYLLLALKVCILVGMCWFIYSKISQDQAKPFKQLISLFKTGGFAIYWQMALWIAMAFVNWALEAKKWQLLVKQVENISYLTAWRQTYASLTASLITPQRVGEYGAKAMYYSVNLRRSILWLTFAGNGAQMLVTLLFGTIGISFAAGYYTLPIAKLNLVLIVVVLLLLAFLGYLFRERELLFQGLSINNLIAKTLALPRQLKFKILGLSMLRYCVFGSLFYLMLDSLGVSVLLKDALILIPTYYLLISVTPMLFIFDVIVKGGIAMWLFSLINVSSGAIVMVILLGWLLNFALPAIIGSYFVIQFKPKTT